MSVKQRRKFCVAKPRREKKALHDGKEDHKKALCEEQRR